MAKRATKKSLDKNRILKRGIGIVRVSTAEQANEERYSIPHQKAHIAEECKKRGVELIHIFEFVQSGAKVLSSSSKERENILRFIEQNNITHVFIHELDRLARSMTDTLLFTDELTKRHVSLISAHDPIDTSTPQGVMQMQILAVFAEYFRKQLASKVMGSMKERAKEGKPLGKTPFGYGIGQAGFEIIPDEAEIVRKIFNLYTEENMGLRAVAAYLNQMGLRTRKGNEWSHATIRDILENEAYIGTFTWDEEGTGIRLENNHQAIIDTETFNKAQSRRLTKSRLGGRAQNQNFLLSGLLKCGHCVDPATGNNVSMAGRTNRKGKYCYRYYRCNNYASKGTCPSHEYRADQLEKLVLEDVEQLVKNGPAIFKDLNMVPENIDSLKNDLEIYERQLKNLDNALDRAAKAYESGVYDLEYFKKRKIEITAEKSQLKRDINNLRAQLNGRLPSAEINRRAIAKIQTAAQFLQETDILLAKAYLQNIIDHIIVKSKEDIVIYYRL